MRSIRLLGAILLVALTPHAFAQQPEDATRAAPFEAYPQKWLAQGVLDFSFYSFYLGAPAVRGVAYLPNFSPRVGARLAYKGSGLAVMLPLPSQDVERRGNSDQLSAILSPHFRDFALNAYYQYYRGFYESSPWTEIDPNKPARYPQLPDTVVQNWGLTTFFALERSHYSLKAAFSQTERQMGTGGSFLVSPFFNSLSIATNGRYVPGSAPDASKTGPNVTAGAFRTLGLGGGYGYAYVRGAWLAALQGILGFGVQHQQIERPEGGLDERISLALRLNASASIGWSWDEHHVGAKALVESLSARVSEQQFASSLVSAQIYYGQRF